MVCRLGECDLNRGHGRWKAKVIVAGEAPDRKKSGSVRQISEFHWQLSVDMDDVDAVVDGMDFDQTHGSWFRLNFFQNVGISVNEDD